MKINVFFVCRIQALIDLWKNFISTPTEVIQTKNTFTAPYLDNLKFLYQKAFDDYLIKQIHDLNGYDFLISKYTNFTIDLFSDTLEYIFKSGGADKFTKFVFGEELKEKFMNGINYIPLRTFVFLLFLCKKTEEINNFLSHQIPLDLMAIPESKLEHYSFDKFINELVTENNGEPANAIVSDKIIKTKLRFNKKEVQTFGLNIFEVFVLKKRELVTHLYSFLLPAEPKL